MASEFEAVLHPRSVLSLGILTAPGVTASGETPGVNLTFQVTVSNIGTNVVIRFEGSLDGIGYFPLYDATQTDTTLTANGVYGYTVYAPVRYVRARLVSLSGGTPSIATLVGAA